MDSCLCGLPQNVLHDPPVMAEIGEPVTVFWVYVIINMQGGVKLPSDPLQPTLPPSSLSLSLSVYEL